MRFFGGKIIGVIHNRISAKQQKSFITDIFVVIGTSLNVYPAAGLLHYVKRGVPVYLIDPNTVNDPYGKVTTYIKGVASEGVKQLTELLLKENK